MRFWYKYYLDSASSGVRRLPIDQSYEDHVKGMGDYNADEAYASAASFFEKYLPRTGGKHDCFDKFLRKRLKKGERILSVASGRAATELSLSESGYDITCSDLELPDAYDATRKLFPGIRYIKADILHTPLSEKYDAIAALGLIYLFDKDELKLFFERVAMGLSATGHLLLDSAGSPDNLLSFMVHDVILRVETEILRWFKFFKTGKMPGLVIKHHGYRRTDEEIIRTAESCGFRLVHQENYCYLSEFERSRFLNKLIRAHPFFKHMLAKIGRGVPYIRMFDFVKVS